MTENQIKELFRLIGVSIQKNENIENRLENFENKFEEFENKFEEFENKFEESEEINATFRDETKQILGEIKQELRFMNRKVDVQMEDLMQTKYKVRDVEERVKVLEEKEVA